MSDRQTMNVSLPESQEQFVRGLVASGRYRSASEVLRDGLRLLQEAEHRRLLEKWLYEGRLTKDEESQLPDGALERAKKHIRELVEKGIEDARNGKVVDGPAAMGRMRERLEKRRARRSA